MDKTKRLNAYVTYVTFYTELVQNEILIMKILTKNKILSGETILSLLLQALVKCAYIKLYT